jgi:DNA (cytosine-5)-methyltransferase 1
VTAHLQKDCYKFIHYSQPRTITVREAARLQSFPDWFRFEGLSMVASFGLIGNAVPPLMAQAFAESFAEADAALFTRGIITRSPARAVDVELVAVAR